MVVVTLLYGKIEQTTTQTKATNDILEVQKQINILQQRVKLLQNSLPCISWTDTTTKKYNVVDIFIDKDLLKNNNDDDYIGKAYAIEFINNKKYYKPIYFKKSELKELYKQ